MQSLQAASASPRCGAETAITTDGSPIPTRPTRWAIATRAEVVRALEVRGQLLHHLLGHALVGLVVEVEDGAAAGLDARRADEDRDAAGALVGDLGDHGRRVERLSLSRNAPPDTGGMSATSSPSASSRSGGAYARLTA